MSLCIVHLHIPKTAGSTFNQMLRRKFSDDQIYEYPSYFNDSGYDEHDLLRANKTRLVALGHLDFRCQSILPEQVAMVSFLRDPVERVLSGYYNILRDTTNPAHELVRRMSLGEYVESGVVRDVDNGQVRRISGIGMDAPCGEVTEAHLVLAMENIANNRYFIGITERFDESLLLLEDFLAIDLPHYVAVNTGTNRPKGDYDDAVQTQKIRSLNIYDQQLYDAQLAVLEWRLNAAPGLQARLGRFRHQQLVYRYFSLPARLGKRLRNRLRQQQGRKPNQEK